MILKQGLSTLPLKSKISTVSSCRHRKCGRVGRAKDKRMFQRQEPSLSGSWRKLPSFLGKRNEPLKIAGERRALLTQGRSRWSPSFDKDFSEHSQGHRF